MDPLTHFRGHNCTETNTHTQHKGILSLYVHAYANVCVRAYIYIYAFVRVHACTSVHYNICTYVCSYNVTYVYTYDYISSFPKTKSCNT